MSGIVEKSDIDQVRESVDLVGLIAEHVPLRPKGREHVGLCPFHEDHSPSLTVVTHKGNAFYKCHSCGAAGDAFNFVMDYHKMSFGEALELLAARRAGILQRERRQQGRLLRDWFESMMQLPGRRGVVLLAVDLDARPAAARR